MEAVGREIVLRSLPATVPTRLSRVGREREARLYWDTLTPRQEAWALRKMGFFAMGSPKSTA